MAAATEQAELLPPKELIAVNAFGVHDIPNDMYHADPVPGGSLSSSGAKRLLPPSTPAHFDHQRKHGQPPKKAFDLGHAAHRLVLSEGAEIEVIPGERWDTNIAKAAVAKAREEGRIPLKEKDHEVVKAMAEKIREHPIASQLFKPGSGKAEQSLFWRDVQSGIVRRARLDWLPNPNPNGRLIIPDYKTTHDASPLAAQKTMEDWDYALQADWYEDGAEELGLSNDAVMVLVMQEKTAPYLVAVYQPDATAMRIAAWRNRTAIDIYAACTKSGRWPGYSDDVELLALPGWAEQRYLQEMP